MSKTYNGWELIQAISSEEIKEGTRIEVHDLSVTDRLVTTIMINRDKGIIWQAGEFYTSMLANEYYYFKPINDDIDIDSIEELKKVTTQSETYESVYENREKINELVRAVKKLNNKW